jgi:Zn-dependent protease
MRFKLGRYLGIDVFLHWTFFLAPLYLAYEMRWGQNYSWPLVGLFLLLLFAVFGCVLLHEYGHALMARHFGVNTRDIIVTPIGGIARLERMPRKPFQELLITIAGPSVNLLIGAVLMIGLLAFGSPLVPRDELKSVFQFPLILMWMNLFLFLFNLIPAFPMDGGRILRSTLAFFVDYQSATMVAGILGQIVAVGFCFVGLVFGQFSLLLIGGFVFFAARMEIAASRQVFLGELERQQTELGYRIARPGSKDHQQLDL